MLLTVFLLATSLPAYSQNYGIGDTTATKDERFEAIKESWPQFELSFGGFFAGYNSGISLGLEQLGLGINIDLEEALNLKNSGIVLRGDAKYSFGKGRRSGVMIGFFDINRSSKLVLEKVLEIGETEFPIGTEIDSKYNLTIIRAKYSFAFVHDERVSFGFSVGLFVLPLSFSIGALGHESQKANFIAPLPVVGLAIKVKLTKKFSVVQSSEFLYLSTTNIGGSIIDLNFKLFHQTFDHFGFGFAINTTTINVYSRQSGFWGLDFVGEIKMGYTGVALYASYYF